MTYWLIGGLLVAAVLILIAVTRVGGSTDNDPYNGDGW